LEKIKSYQNVNKKNKHDLAKEANVGLGHMGIYIVFVWQMR